jgi:prepilin-type N-terminal cleavage/methylation domain-containing protein
MRQQRVGALRVGGLPGGFTIVELMVVLIIIGVMMAIIVPSMAAVRASARKVQSLAVMNNVSTASSQFITDRRAAPGYFSAAEMGSTENGVPGDASSGRGFTGMQNIMLDLAGGIAGDQSINADGLSVLEVGPTAARTIKVDVAQIGRGPQGQAAYFVPDRTFFVAQRSEDRQAGSVNDHRNLPVLVDAFGSPILAWSLDERVTTITRTNANDLNFAGVNSGNTLYRSYWAQNWAFMAATSLAGLGRNQQFDSDGNRAFSMLGTGLEAQSLAASLVGLLGSPAQPLRDGREATAGIAPSTARGVITFHAAGPNGYYLGSLEPGGLKARRSRGAGDPPTPNSVDYVTGGVDALDGFDDQVVAVGG